MTTATRKQAETAAAIRRHGENLLAIFPNATEQDPDKLCRKLRRYELKASRITVDLCNGDRDQGEADAELDAIRSKVRAILGDTDGAVWINRDPRGYALKAELPPEARVHRDLGGNAIIAPDLTPNN